MDVAERGGARDLSFVDEALTPRVAERFHELHHAEYGHDRRGEVPEITGVRLVASAATPQPGFGRGRSAPSRAPEPAGTRPANLGRGFEPTSIFHGPDLAPGHQIDGPAIIEETFTTIVVHPGWQAVVDDAGDYLLAQR